MRKAAELYLKGATVKYLISLRLAGRLPELALRKDSTASTGSTSNADEYTKASFQLIMITRRVSVVIVEFHFAEMTRDHCFANELYYTTCMCC